MKLPKKKEARKKTPEEMLAELQEAVKSKEKARKKRMCATCPYGSPWKTNNKYKKVKFVLTAKPEQFSPLLTQILPHIVAQKILEKVN